MPKGEDFAEVVYRNIQALVDARQRHEAAGGLHHRMADRVARAMGTMGSVYLHLAVVAAWVVPNTGLLPGVTPWDPLPCHALGVVVGCEAIVLTLLVLASQNRERAMAERRADLDVQINLLAEHEITKVLEIVRAVASRLEIDEDLPVVDDLEREIDPEQLLAEIDRARDEG